MNRNEIIDWRRQHFGAIFGKIITRNSITTDNSTNDNNKKIIWRDTIEEMET